MVRDMSQDDTSHKRRIILFNDSVLITKVLNKKKNKDTDVDSLKLMLRIRISDMAEIILTSSGLYN